MSNIFSTHSSSRRGGRNLIFAMVVGAFAVTGTATVNAQSTAGRIFGTAPAGYSVSAQANGNATRREVKVRSNGRYAIRGLPVGTYTVTLTEDGHAVMEHLNVPVTAARGSEVKFDCAPDRCAETAGNR